MIYTGTRSARAWGFIVLAIFVRLVFPLPRVDAAVSSCTASVSPGELTAGTTSTVTVTVNNTSSSTIVWINVSAPSGEFAITGGSSSGWTNSQGASFFNLTGGSLAASGSYSFTMQVAASSTSVSGVSWAVSVSDDSGGAGATSCTGTFSASITGGSPSGSPPSISNIVVSDVADTSVKISWDTDLASDTVVEYGTTDSYGSSTSGASSTTGHSVTISGLSANTTYHYNVKSANSYGTTESGDNSFVTAKSGSSGSSTTGTVRTVTATPTPTAIPDRTPPRIAISTKFDHPFTSAPRIEGKATDPSGVASVEYSFDGGINFLPVDELTKSGKLSATFYFIPYQTDDGNYQLVIRSTDVKGNQGDTKIASVVIDRMPLWLHDRACKRGENFVGLRYMPGSRMSTRLFFFA